ncbi:glycosyltransferase [Oerskovia jenensis]|uniref:glycosyltransferase n=1 Tax=Oerskovia jenensis TaxID=162169 RepID=UPI0036DE6EAD
MSQVLTDISEIDTSGEPVLEVSVVVPVYRGAATLPDLMSAMDELSDPRTTPDGRRFRVCETILVWDHGPDESDTVIAELADKYAWIRPVWLSRNFGQHPATVAGMASSRGDWVVTMDEDGQHDPRDIGLLLDVAMRDRASLVYASPTNKPPHSRLRNVASALTKGVVLRALSGRTAVPFHSFRLISGEHARAVAAYCGPGVYLDVALGWVISDVSACPIRMHDEGRASTSYNPRRLASHFWRLVVSSGNRPLRLVSAIGVVTSALGLLYALVLVVRRLAGLTVVDGWTSAIVVTLIIGGMILLSLGVIAEYLGMAANMSMGKPLYVTTSAPRQVTSRERR